MNTALSLLPNNDARDLFAKLRDAAKAEWAQWADAIIDIQSALTDSRSPRLTLYHHWAARLNTSARSVRRKFSDYINGTDEYPACDWRILVNKSKAGSLYLAALDPSDTSDLSDLPPAFIDYVRLLTSGNQRKSRPAIRRDGLLHRHLAAWRDGKSWTFKGVTYYGIPGYCSSPCSPCLRGESPPPNADGKRHPRGWSERNLYHKLNTPEQRTEFALARIGTAEALQTLPPIPRTRHGIRFLEIVFFDDVWNDRKVLVAGYPKPVRLLQLGCLDYATGCYLKFGQRPELPTDDGTRERIKERDMLWLVAQVLEEWGYPLEYDMHLVLEHGTATLREHDARALYDWSGGRIKPCYITLEGDLVFVWDERVRGNPRGKAALESWHNLFHNENAFTAGQVGMDRDHSPAILPAQEREAASLVTVSHFLTPTQKARLGFPFPSQEQAYWETHETIRTINNRFEHRLEGFDTVVDWRIKGETTIHADHEAVTHPTFPQLHAAGLIEFLPRMETPIERLRRLSDVPRGTIHPDLLTRFYTDSRTVARLQPDGTFAFRRHGKDYIFQNPGRTSYHESLTSSSVQSSTFDVGCSTLKPGVEYLLHHAPFDPSHVHITLSGSYVGTWPRLRAPRDQKELAEAIRVKTNQINARASNLRRVHSEQIAAEDKRVQENLRVITEANLIPSPAVDPAHTPKLAPSHGLSLATAYQAETELAAERQRTKDILEGRVTTSPTNPSDPSYSSDSDDIFSDNSEPRTNQPNVTDDELNSIL